jgi:threonylcarbamoyladenosine tRNA methylthiotransferase MtaB
MGFSEMHVFPYSKRTGTPAARMEDQVDEEVKNTRVHALIDLSERMQLAYAERFVGEELEIIPERDYKGQPGSGLIMGYSDNYLSVVFEGSEEWIGRVCRVKVTEAGVNECRGVVVGAPDAADAGQATLRLASPVRSAAGSADSIPGQAAKAIV